EPVGVGEDGLVVEGRHRRLEVEAAGHADGNDLVTETDDGVPQGLGTRRVGPPRDTDVEPPAENEHVAAVEASRRRNAGERTMRRERGGDGVDLASARRRAGMGENGPLVE